MLSTCDILVTKTKTKMIFNTKILLLLTCDLFNGIRFHFHLCITGIPFIFDLLTSK